MKSTVAMVVLTVRLKSFATNCAVATSATGTEAYRIKGLNLPRAPTLRRESSSTPVSISVKAVKNFATRKIIPP
ncbi:hypothetical protein D3C81_1934700 [compost metagenome]